MTARRPRLVEPLSDSVTIAPRTPSRPAMPLSRPSGASRPLIPTRAWEDEDAAWQDRSGGNRDDDLKREKPPHW